MKLIEKFPLSSGLFSEMKTEEPAYYSDVFGELNPAYLDIDLMSFGASRECAEICELCDNATLAHVLWSHFYEKWKYIRFEFDADNTIDYITTTEGTNTKVNNGTSSQNTDNGVYGFNSTETVDDSKNNVSGSTTDNGTETRKTTTTYKGRNRGDKLDDLMKFADYRRKLTSEIMHDILNYITLPIYL